MSEIFFQLYESNTWKAPYIQTGEHSTNGFSYGDSWAQWKPSFPVSGHYKVLLKWSADDKHTSSILYKIYSQGKVIHVSRNQQTNASSWIYLGSYYFDEGLNETNKLVLEINGRKNLQLADAVWFVLEPDRKAVQPLNKDQEELTLMNLFDHKS